MTSAALKSSASSTITIERADLASAIFSVTGPAALSIKAGTLITVAGTQHVFEHDTPVETIGLVPGQDYGVRFGADGAPLAVPIGPLVRDDGVTIGGFHFAPFGNATARDGGTPEPAINPFSCWDTGFRPICPDPRGMTLVELPGGKLFWADIYLLGQDHLDDGTSHFGAAIADGATLPQKVSGRGKCRKLDHATAVEIYALHGKQLLGAEESFAAYLGVKERASRDGEPEKTGETDGLPFVSRRGIIDATGTMWQWGTDGDPDTPRASIFGGSWWSGGNAGSRCAYLGNWPESSGGNFSARGRSDHLSPA